MPNNVDPQKLLDHIRSNPMLAPKHCSSCGFAHTATDLKLLGYNQGDVSLQLACASCGLVQVVKMSPGGPMTIQRFESNNSDINPTEFSKFAGMPAVSKDEALEVYSHMQEVSGLEDLLGRMND